jgi:hypothetical protein
MHCTRVNVGGIKAMVCGPRRLPVCSFCRSFSNLLCDFLVGRKKTCDKSLCSSCAINVAPNVDLCPDHPLPATQLVLELPSL